MPLLSKKYKSVKGVFWGLNKEYKNFEIFNQIKNI